MLMFTCSSMWHVQTQRWQGCFFFPLRKSVCVIGETQLADCLVWRSARSRMLRFTRLCYSLIFREESSVPARTLKVWMKLIPRMLSRTARGMLSWPLWLSEWRAGRRTSVLLMDVVVYQLFSFSQTVCKSVRFRLVCVWLGGGGVWEGLNLLSIN